MGIVQQVFLFFRSLGVMFGMNDNDREVTPDPKHVDGEYRRLVVAPVIFQSLVGQTVKCDPDFERMLPTREGEYIVRFCVDGDVLKGNVYSLERYKGGLFTPAYNPTWQSDHIVDFHLDVSHDPDSGLSQKMTPITNVLSVASDLSYNRFSPCRSYQLTLTPDELVSFGRCTIRAHKGVHCHVIA